MSTYAMGPGTSAAPQRLLALVADSIAGSAEQTRSALAACGAQAVVVTTPGEAEPSVRNRAPDLVVVDVDFGGRRQGLRLVETAHRCTKASIIVVASDVEAASGAVLSERCHLLHRPVHGGQLRATICLALARHAVRVTVPPGSDGRRRELEDALQQIGTLISSLTMRTAAPARPKLSLVDLRPRERQIAELLLQHHRVPAVASRLGISANTVRNHLKNIFRRLGVHSQQELLDALKGTQD